MEGTKQGGGMTHPFTALLGSFLGQSTTLVIHVPILKLLKGDYAAAALLAQCAYWTGKGSDWEGHNTGWFYKSQKDWESELIVSTDTIRRCVKSLKKFGLETALKGVPAKMYYRVNLDVLAQCLLDSQNGKTPLNPVMGKPNNLILGFPITSYGKTQELGTVETHNCTLYTKITYRDYLQRKDSSFSVDTLKTHLEDSHEFNFLETPTELTREDDFSLSQEPKKVAISLENNPPEPSRFYAGRGGGVDNPEPVAPKMPATLPDSGQNGLTAGRPEQVHTLEPASDSRATVEPKTKKAPRTPKPPATPKAKSETNQTRGVIAGAVGGYPRLASLLGEIAITPRSKWLEIPLERVCEIKAQSVQVAQTEGRNPKTVFILALDAEIAPHTTSLELSTKVIHNQAGYRGKPQSVQEANLRAVQDVQDAAEYYARTRGEKNGTN